MTRKRKYRPEQKLTETDILRIRGWFVFYILQGLGAY